MIVTEPNRSEFTVKMNLQERGELKEQTSCNNPSMANALHELIQQGLLPSVKCRKCEHYGT